MARSTPCAGRSKSALPRPPCARRWRTRWWARHPPTWTCRVEVRRSRKDPGSCIRPRTPRSRGLERGRGDRADGCPRPQDPRRRSEGSPGPRAFSDGTRLRNSPASRPSDPGMSKRLATVLVGLTLLFGGCDRGPGSSYSPSAQPAHDPAHVKVRAELAAHRAQELDRLREYARAGAFPLNTTQGPTGHFFQDAAGHYCAVANLVHQDGRDDSRRLGGQDEQRARHLRCPRRTSPRLDPRERIHAGGARAHPASRADRAIAVPAAGRDRRQPCTPPHGGSDARGGAGASCHGGSRARSQHRREPRSCHRPPPSGSPARGDVEVRGRFTIRVSNTWHSTDRRPFSRMRMWIVERRDPRSDFVLLKRRGRGRRRRPGGPASRRSWIPFQQKFLSRSRERFIPLRGGTLGQFARSMRWQSLANCVGPE